MTDQDGDRRILNDRRITIIVGHYGSGKTEFSVNYAVRLAEEGERAEHGIRTALVDLDIANPYFRSRERRQLLEEKGVQVYSNTFGYDITADLPAITARIRAPLEAPAGAADPDSCTGCGSCAIMCPDGVISVYRKD